ncbi:homeobox domain-containing protein, partial [Mortierella sp. GBAus27b]
RRRRLTMDETEYLMAQFCKNEKPNTKERLVFAEHLGLHPRTIQVWFQNRRAKLKR